MRYSIAEQSFRYFIYFIRCFDFMVKSSSIVVKSLWVGVLMVSLFSALVLFPVAGCGDSGSGNGSNLDGGSDADVMISDSSTDGDVLEDGSICGNGVLEPPETCDGTDFGGMTCQELGYEGGALSCTSECTLDTSGCGFLCGNGVIDEGEDCDGAAFGGVTCQSLGFEPGVLGCNSDCTWDLSGCPGCGNGVMEADEWCDGDDFGALSCNGELQCTEDCHLDTTGCFPLGLGDGSDGSLEVTGTLLLNEYAAPAHGVAAMGNDRVELNEEPGAMNPGDEVLLINLQGSLSECDTSGVYEFKSIDTINGTEVLFSSVIEGVYGADGDNEDLTGQSVILQRVPNFSNVIVRSGGLLTVASWNGAKGGVLAMRVSGELLIEYGGEISVNARGYRGGAGYTFTGEADGRQGESICGDPQAAVVSPNYGGGGGGYFGVEADDPCGQGGGGGGYGSPGGWVDYSQTCRDSGNVTPAENGGDTYGSPGLQRLFFGSGGGGGATDDHSDESGSGGRGGGVLFLTAKHLSLAGVISAGGSGGSAGGGAPVTHGRRPGRVPGPPGRSRFPRACLP